MLIIAFSNPDRILSALPDGVSCFVDANIICYHLVQTPPLSEECPQFIKRIERGTFRVSTSAAIVAEAIHKVMLAEAIQQHKLDHRGLPTDCNASES